jgi:hypothetical protein
VSRLFSEGWCDHFLTNRPKHHGGHKEQRPPHRAKPFSASV